jgi:hypothetical protein
MTNSSGKASFCGNVGGLPLDFKLSIVTVEAAKVPMAMRSYRRDAGDQVSSASSIVILRSGLR